MPVPGGNTYTAAMWWLPAKIFGLLTAFRAWLYARGLFSSRSLERPVISVGNLTVGGSGKTPFVAYLARILRDAGYQPIVLSRGYRGRAEKTGLVVSDGETVSATPEEAGDEPYMLACELPGVAVAVGRDRYRSGRRLEDRFEKAIHLLDDGFQHLALKRNLNILLLDATDPFGGYRLLPAGRLREPLSALGRADLVVVTRSHLAASSEEIEEVVRRYHPRVPIQYFYHDMVGIRDLRTGHVEHLRGWVNRPVSVLAAVGNPAALLADLRLYQLRVVAEYLHRDHHPFRQQDLERALEPLSRGQAEAVVTTEKDAVRLGGLEFEQRQVWAVQIRPRAEDDAQYRRTLLEEVENLPPAR